MQMMDDVRLEGGSTHKRVNPVWALSYKHFRLSYFDRLKQG